MTKDSTNPADKTGQSQPVSLSDAVDGTIAGEFTTDDPLDKVVLYAFDQARQKLEEGGIVEPFTILVKGENLYIESHPGEDAVECFNSARKTVFEMEQASDAYVFCYDGYVDLDEGTRDALVVERARKDDDLGEAFAILYTEDEDDEEGGIEFEDSIYDLGEASSLYKEEPFTPEDLEEL
ncbi:MAG: hypothetical protein LBS58_02415 [Coriobacteriales bacterium]|nr:hypothetical protein [Coriobacteriales bacterium]